MLKLKFQYFSYLMQTVKSLEKTLMLGKVEGKRRRGCQRMRRLDGITDAMDMNMGKLCEIMRNREAWSAACQASLTLTSPEVCPSSCPLHQWCHPAISSTDALFSFCPQSLPASRTFPGIPLLSRWSSEFGNLSSFGIRVMVNSQNVFGSVPSSSVFRKSLRRFGLNSFLYIWCEAIWSWTFVCREWVGE